MTLAQAISNFSGRADDADAPGHIEPAELLTDYFSPAEQVEEITPRRLRDFLGRWYAEAAQSRTGDHPEQIPDVETLTRWVERFLLWARESAQVRVADECFAVLREAGETLPRAQMIASALKDYLGQRGGAFTFPEFLTSFEQGGQSRYDLDAPGDVGALEGYFRVARVEGSSVEAEEMISEEVVWPIIFPESVAGLLRPGYILNLEIVRVAGGWQIADSGFVYPPGTDIAPE